ncbi:steroid transmembrane transporter SLC22A24 isoform X2 [Erinaceus europaeus]|uniref:Steroid transmembrane transporter SLC22A24 isoform X2 n=1 Tax=Erinaceus europaeus TaxID=9365 RepID=A0ABM3W6Y4_ERIEU|nr:steroid transmembrane transporter SLC22A24 isoform X2 [Erinaceus europaeus]
MAFAELLDQVGNLGRFQILQIVFLCTTIIIMYPHLFLENFTAAIPAHRCWVHLLDNDTISANDTGTLSQEDLLRVSIPLDSSLRPEKCRRFIHPQWQLLHQNGTFPNVTELDTEPCVDGWVYDRSTFSSTIVTEWELVCESQSLRLVVQSVLMTGALLGSPVYGYLSDRFGRKLGLRLSILQLAITGTSAAMAPNLLIYSSLRFLAGFCITVIVSNSCALMLEWVQPQSRALVTMLMLNVCSAGQILLGGLASAIQDWRTLMLIFSVPLFVNFLVSRKLVESAQWLIISNRIEEGVKELRRAARINGRLHAEENLTFEFVKSTMQKELDTPQVKISVFELFRAPKLRLRVCFTSLLRFATGLTFYGLALNVQYFGKSIFLAQILFGSVILASRCVFYPALNHIGRRTSQLLLFFTSGLCFLAIAFLFQG